MTEIRNPIVRPPYGKGFKPSVHKGDGCFVCPAEYLGDFNGFALKQFGPIIAMDCGVNEDAQWLFENSCRSCVNGPRDGGGCKAKVLGRFLVPHLDAMQNQGLNVENLLNGNSSNIDYGGPLGKDMQFRK